MYKLIKFSVIPGRPFMASFQPGLPPSISTPIPYGSRVENFNMPKIHNLAITVTWYKNQGKERRKKKEKNENSRIIMFEVFGKNQEVN